MKRILLSLISLLVFSPVFAGWTNSSFVFGGQTRTFRTYVPASYTPSNPATLIVVLHGLGGSMYDAEDVGITAIADTANIILLSPQALDFMSPIGLIQAAWNSGIVVTVPGIGPVTVNGSVDDVGFVKAMMDSTMADYAIKPLRVYACGASLGGFLTQRLACEAADRFAAVASVMGTYALALPACNPGKVLPVAHFHGTNDEVVGWNGDLQVGTMTFPVGLSVEDLIAKWVDINDCNTTPQHDTWPDANNDNLYVEHFTYANAAGQSKVELFKVNGGTHYWYQNSDTDGEIDYAFEIWKFFNKQYDNLSSIGDKDKSVTSVTVYPNPVSHVLRVKSSEVFTDAQITDLYGRGVLSATRPASGIDISRLTPGIYLVKLSTAKGISAVRQFVKQ